MSATYADVLAAILSMDAYNEGPDDGMLVPNRPSQSTSTIVDGIPPGSTPTMIDNVTITEDSTQVQGIGTPAEYQYSFYAIAYNDNGNTIISYRGTRFPGGPDGNAVKYGWTISAGYANAPQAQLALQFFNDVCDANTQNITLTGHSLGGGLAGFVADVEGISADVFNNLPFGSAVVAEELALAKQQGRSYASVLTDGTLSSANVRQFTTLGDVASGMRVAVSQLAFYALLWQTGSVSIATAALALGDSLDLSTTSEMMLSDCGIKAPTGLSLFGLFAQEINLHSMPLSALLTYADWRNFTDWQSLGPSLYSA